MVSEELRAGNYVQSEGISIPRLQIHSDGMTKITAYGIELFNQGYLDWKPIPLTEDILLNNIIGSRKAILRPPYDEEEDDFNYWDLPYDLNGVDLGGYSIYFINDLIIGEKDGMYCVLIEMNAADESQYLRQISRSFEFVHELQNIYPYFCLDGYELDLNI